MTRKSSWSPAAFAAAIIIGTVSAAGQAPAASEDKLIVHEWGTFTSVQGSNGIALEGLQHEEEPLPSFVYSRTKVREHSGLWAAKGLNVPIRSVTQKMETPVIYFHTRSTRSVAVRVEFVKGLITQWYPVGETFSPPEMRSANEPLDLASIDRSSLTWNVELIPPGLPAKPPPPAVGENDPWIFARAVDAATVRTLPRTIPERSEIVESEKYLFYRGLGTFSLPVAVESANGGKVVVRNGGKLPLPFAFALEMKGSTGRFHKIGAITAGGEKQVDHGPAPEKPKAEVVAGLEGAVTEELVASGLYHDEAAAMVKTWSRAWFSSEGTRIIYSVPRAEVDALLPLSITPTPDDLVRVLVGRIEYMTPETEGAVESALRERSSADAATREAAMARLAKLDRFLEPHVRRILAKSTDAAVRKSAEEILAALKN